MSFNQREFRIWNNIPTAFLVSTLLLQTKEINSDGNLLISMPLNQNIVRVIEKDS